MAQQQECRNKHTHHYWQTHIRKLQESGRSRAEYCRQQKLSYHALTYWHRKLANSSPGSSALVPIPVQKIIRQSMATTQGAGVKILVGNDVAIEVAERFSSSALNQVLSVLEQR